MHTFVFQTSRWQFLSYLTSVVDELSRQAPEGEEADDIQRKHDNLARAAETTRHHLRGPDICGDGNQTAVTELLDLTPISKQDGLLSKHIWQFVDELDRESRIKRIKGIPKAAEIGREGHIY